MESRSVTVQCPYVPDRSSALAMPSLQLLPGLRGSPLRHLRPHVLLGRVLCSKELQICVTEPAGNRKTGRCWKLFVDLDSGQAWPGQEAVQRGVGAAAQPLINCEDLSILQGSEPRQSAFRLELRLLLRSIEPSSPERGCEGLSRPRGWCDVRQLTQRRNRSSFPRSLRDYYYAPR